MRSDVGELPSKDVVRTVKVNLLQTATFSAALSAGIDGGTDLSDRVTAIKCTDNTAQITLADLNSQVCAEQPKPGDIIAIYAQSVLYYLGIIDSIDNYIESRGRRTLTIVARSRDGFGMWRDNHFVTSIYPEGTELSRIARDIAQAMGLTNDEILLTDTGYVTPHANSQMADMTPWEMLRTLFQAASSQPMMDMVGRLKMANRDTTRPADMTLDNNRVIEIKGGRARSSITNVKVRWLDKDLTKIAQQDQILTRETITAGFFQQRYERDQWFSEDHTQRVENSHMVILQSANSGLVDFCSETYNIIDIYHGQVVLEVSAWVPGLIIAFIAVKVAIAALPDSGGFPCYPIGRLVTVALDAFIMGILASIGTGHYEIWGQPYDFVHGRNTTEAYNAFAPSWMDNELVIENDFISNRPHARKVATDELVYHHNSASGWGVRIVDDPRVEVGDIIEVTDGTRLYVTGFERDLSRGAPAVLDIKGFRC